MTTGLIIDCDPGHDDAMAILYAARHLNLIGITTVFGNTSLANATRNAQGICALAGIKVPIAAGMSAPLVAAAVSAADIHGPSGLDGATLPEPARDVIKQHAVQFIIEQAKAANGELVLAPLGPLTNIAVALKIEPRLAGMIKCTSRSKRSLSTSSADRYPRASASGSAHAPRSVRSGAVSAVA